MSTSMQFECNHFKCCKCGQEIPTQYAPQGQSNYTYDYDEIPQRLTESYNDEIFEEYPADFCNRFSASEYPGFYGNRSGIRNDFQDNDHLCCNPYPRRCCTPCPRATTENVGTDILEPPPPTKMDQEVMVFPACQAREVSAMSNCSLAARSQPKPQQVECPVRERKKCVTRCSGACARRNSLGCHPRGSSPPGARNKSTERNGPGGARNKSAERTIPINSSSSRHHPHRSYPPGARDKSVEKISPAGNRSMNSSSSGPPPRGSSPPGAWNKTNPPGGLCKKAQINLDRMGSIPKGYGGGAPAGARNNYNRMAENGNEPCRGRKAPCGTTTGGLCRKARENLKPGDLGGIGKKELVVTRLRRCPSFASEHGGSCCGFCEEDSQSLDGYVVCKEIAPEDEYFCAEQITPCRSAKRVCIVETGTNTEPFKENKCLSFFRKIFGKSNKKKK